MSLGSARAVNVRFQMDAERRRTYVLTLEVISTDGTDGVQAAMLASGVPLIYDSYDHDGETDPRAFCINKVVSYRDPKQSHRIFTITCDYSTLTREQFKRTQHPLDRPTEISSTFRQLSTVCWTDTSGNAIDTSAGEIFDPPIEREDARKILRLTRNFADYDGGLGYINRTNSDGYLGAAVGTLKINTFDETRVIEEYGTEGSEDEIEYWVRSVEMEYNPDGWTKNPLDAGMKDSTGKPLLDALGNPLTTPVKLDGAGAVLSPQTGTPTFLSFTVYGTASYSSMNFF